MGEPANAVNLEDYASAVVAVALAIGFLPSNWKSSWERYPASFAGDSMLSTTHVAGYLSAINGTLIMVLDAMLGVLLTPIFLRRQSASMVRLTFR